jgi:hypothetical protein
LNNDNRKEHHLEENNLQKCSPTGITICSFHTNHIYMALYHLERLLKENEVFFWGQVVYT